MTGKGRYAFDLDGTLCVTVDGDYAGARPIPERIAVVRALHLAGAHVIIHTARGDLADQEERTRILLLTRRQLEAWNVPYDELRLKPFAHFYVDDRAVYSEHFFSTKGQRHGEVRTEGTEAGRG